MRIDGKTGGTSGSKNVSKTFFMLSRPHNGPEL